MAYRNRSRKPAREVAPSPPPPKTPEQIAEEKAYAIESEAAQGAYVRREDPDWHLWHDRLGVRVTRLRFVLPPWYDELPVLPSQEERMAICKSTLEDRLPLGPITLWQRWVAAREGKAGYHEYVVLGGLEMLTAFGLPIWHGEELWKVKAPVWHVRGVKLSWEEPDNEERFSLVMLAQGRSVDGDLLMQKRAVDAIWLIHATSHVADVSVHLGVVQRADPEFARLVWESLDGKFYPPN